MIRDWLAAAPESYRYRSRTCAAPSIRVSRSRTTFSSPDPSTGWIEPRCQPETGVPLTYAGERASRSSSSAAIIMRSNGRSSFTCSTKAGYTRSVSSDALITRPISAMTDLSSASRCACAYSRAFSTVTAMRSAAVARKLRESLGYPPPTRRGPRINIPVSVSSAIIGTRSSASNRDSALLSCALMAWS